MQKMNITQEQILEQYNQWKGKIASRKVEIEAELQILPARQKAAAAKIAANICAHNYYYNACGMHRNEYTKDCADKNDLPGKIVALKAELKAINDREPLKKLQEYIVNLESKAGDIQPKAATKAESLYPSLEDEKANGNTNTALLGLAHNCLGLLLECEYKDFNKANENYHYAQNLGDLLGSVNVHIKALAKAESGDKIAEHFYSPLPKKAVKKLLSY
jgi:hypothetical protein